MKGVPSKILGGATLNAYVGQNVHFIGKIVNALPKVEPFLLYSQASSWK